MGDFVRRHPLIAYFLGAYTGSWLLWLPYVLSRNGLGVLGFRFPTVLGTGQLVGLAPGAYLGPLGAAFAVTALAEGRAGLRTWRARLLRWRVGLRWYAFAVLGVPVLLLLATATEPALNGVVRAPSLSALLIFVPMLVVQVLTTGLAEEPGWRDFALPRMQRRYGPLGGTVLLSAGWTGWHAPLFLTDWAIGGTAPSQLALFVLSNLTLSLVITWVFNRTGGSLPAAMLVHSASNNTNSTLWAAVFPLATPQYAYGVHAIGFGALAVVLLVTTRGRLGAPPSRDHSVTERSIVHGV